MIRNGDDTDGPSTKYGDLVLDAGIFAGPTSGIRLHDSRHSHASLLLKQGVHPKVVSERLGHAGIAITMDLYSHTVPNMQKAAAASFDDAIKYKVSQNNSLESR